MSCRSCSVRDSDPNPPRRGTLCEGQCTDNRSPLPLVEVLCVKGSAPTPDPVSVERLHIAGL